jgi:hypothetical protein
MSNYDNQYYSEGGAITFKDVKDAAVSNKMLIWRVMAFVIVAIVIFGIVLMMNIPGREYHFGNFILFVSILSSMICGVLLNNTLNAMKIASVKKVD